MPSTTKISTKKKKDEKKQTKKKTKYLHRNQTTNFSFKWLCVTTFKNVTGKTKYHYLFIVAMLSFSKLT